MTNASVSAASRINAMRGQRPFGAGGSAAYGEAKKRQPFASQGCAGMLSEAFALRRRASVPGTPGERADAGAAAGAIGVSAVSDVSGAAAPQTSPKPAIPHPLIERLPIRHAIVAVWGAFLRNK